jgi:hypothetical protein
MKKLYIVAGVVVIVLTASLVVTFKERTLAPARTEPYEVTLTGMVRCLAKKNPAPLDTAECRHAIETDDGDHYVLDYNLAPEGFTRPSISSRITAKGIVTPLARLNSDEWQKYDMEGIFSATEMLKVQVLQ